MGVHRFDDRLGCGKPPAGVWQAPREFSNIFAGIAAEKIKVRVISLFM